jgi:hypothetical protein
MLRHEPFKTGTTKLSELRVADSLDRGCPRLARHDCHLTHDFSGTQLRHGSLTSTALADPDAKPAPDYKTQKVPGVALPEQNLAAVESKHFEFLFQVVKNIGSKTVE